MMRPILLTFLGYTFPTVITTSMVQDLKSWELTV
jgi:hypothetical protein